MVQYIEFQGEDREYSESKWHFQKRKGTKCERIFSINMTHWKLDDRKDFMGFLENRGIVADYDQLNGHLYILPERDTDLEAEDSGYEMDDEVDE